MRKTRTEIEILRIRIKVQSFLVCSTPLSHYFESVSPKCLNRFKLI